MDDLTKLIAELLKALSGPAKKGFSQFAKGNKHWDDAKLHQHLAAILPIIHRIIRKYPELKDKFGNLVHAIENATRLAAIKLTALVLSTVAIVSEFCEGLATLTTLEILWGVVAASALPAILIYIGEKKRDERFSKAGYAGLAGGAIGFCLAGPGGAFVGSYVAAGLRGAFG